MADKTTKQLGDFYNNLSMGFYAANEGSEESLIDGAKFHKNAENTYTGISDGVVQESMKMSLDKLAMTLRDKGAAL